MGLDIANVLSNLTLQPNLDLLTLRSLSKLVPTRNLLHKNRLWCPQCYSDWKENRQTSYEPLIWKIKSVSICAKHSVYLQEHCFSCKSTNYHVDWKTRPGYCSRCNCWLGEIEKYNNSIQIDKKKDLNYQQNIWLYRNVEEILLKKIHYKNFFSKNTIRETLGLYVQKETEGNISAFAKLLQMPRNTVWLWCRGKNSPSLETLLYICYRLNTSLHDFLKGQEIEGSKIAISTINPLNSQKRKKPQVIDRKKLKDNLEDILHKEEIPPPSMAQVAKNLKISRRAISGHFPELCQKISAAYVEYRKVNQQEQIRKSSQEVERIVLKLHNEGMYPSERRVSKLMSKPGFLRYEPVKQSFTRARKSLGIGI